jgi:hypothetical protein
LPETNLYFETQSVFHLTKAEVLEHQRKVWWIELYYRTPAQELWLIVKKALWPYWKFIRAVFGLVYSIILGLLFLLCLLIDVIWNWKEPVPWVLGKSIEFYYYVDIWYLRRAANQKKKPYHLNEVMLSVHDRAMPPWKFLHDVVDMIIDYFSQ